MKRLSIILFVVSIVMLVSCHYEKPGFYEGNAYIQFYYSGLMNQDTTERITNPLNYPYVSSTRLQDTAWFRLQAVGGPVNRDRKVKFEQYSVELTGSSMEAVPGVNYVAFDDPEMQKYMIIPADSVYMNIPVVILYDTEKKGSFVLNFELVPTEDFELGVPTLLKGKYSISNY